MAKVSAQKFADYAALCPDDPALPATPAALRAVNDEIHRLEMRLQKLREAKSNIQKRMKAA